jgi:hypothetical protein
MKFIVRWLVAIMVCGSAQADVIIDWNTRADAIATEKKLGSPVHGRGLAMMHVAMFEALNAIDRRYQPYRLKLVADRNTSREVAAAVAGHDVLLALYPDQKPGLDALLEQTLTAVPDGPPRERALILGRKAAAEILALRTADGAGAPDTYRPGGATGPVRADSRRRQCRCRGVDTLGDDARRSIPAGAAAGAQLRGMDT